MPENNYYIGTDTEDGIIIEGPMPLIEAFAIAEYETRSEQQVAITRAQSIGEAWLYVTHMINQKEND